MDTYKPLYDHLARQPSDEITMAFEDVEDLGIKLPESARTYRPWWGNEVLTRGRQCRAWLDARWHAFADLDREIVHFRRFLPRDGL